MLRLIAIFLFPLQVWAMAPYIGGKPFPTLRVDRGYEALRVYNYFLAKKIFFKRTKHWPVLHAHGLAVIYFRNDNPFSDPEKAYQQVRLALSGMYIADKREKRRLIFYHIDTDSLISLRSAIESRLFPLKTKNKTLDEYDAFLKNYPETHLSDSVTRLRNHAAFLLSLQQNTPEAFLDFLQKYPGAADSAAANVAYERRLYETMTGSGKLEDYESFLRSYPSSPFVELAKDSVYSLYMRGNESNSIHAYILKYPSSAYLNDAWKKLFFLEIKDLSPQSLTQFLEKYPAYPEKDRLREEIELAATRLWIVKESGKFGFIDGKGSWVIRPEFDHLENFSEGYAAAIRDGKAGFINRRGNDALPFVFLEVSSFLKGYAAARVENGWGLLDHSGSWVIKPGFEEIEYNGDSVVLVTQGEQSYYLNLKGNAVWSRSYQQLGGFSEGLCLAEDTGKYGYLRFDGSIAIPFLYDWAEPFKGSLARVQSGDFFGIINPLGTYVLPAEYDFVGPFDLGLAVVIKDGKAGFSDESGKIVIPIQFDVSPEMQTGKVFHDDFARVMLKGKAGLIDRKGFFIIPPRYADVLAGRPDPSVVKKGSNWFIIDQGQKLLPLKKVDYITAFQGGLVRARKKDLWGLIDQKGKWILPPEFEEIEPLEETFFRVKKNGLFGLQSLNGNVILPPAFDVIKTFSDQMLQIERNGKMAIFKPGQNQYLWKEKDF